MEPLEEVEDADEAERLSFALRHKRIDDPTLTCPYFTDEQWKAVVKERSGLDEAEELVELVAKKGQLPTQEDQEKGKKLLGRKRKLWLCNCKVHQVVDEFYVRVLGVLVSLQSPLNDASGKMFATVFLSHVLKKENLRKLLLYDAGGGTVGTVKYVLRLPSGAELLFSGRPNFLIHQMFTNEERQLGTRTGEEEAVRGIGAPRGTSPEVKDRAFSQAGIYTLGHFANIHKLATVVLYKDFTAHVALARPQEGDEVGNVSYKMVHSLNVFNLLQREGLSLFCSVFIATVKTTLT